MVPCVCRDEPQYSGAFSVRGRGRTHTGLTFFSSLWRAACWGGCQARQRTPRGRCVLAPFCAGTRVCLTRIKLQSLVLVPGTLMAACQQHPGLRPRRTGIPYSDCPPADQGAGRELSTAGIAGLGLRARARPPAAAPGPHVPLCGPCEQGRALTGLVLRS